jgi:hypothetical protein
MAYIDFGMCDASTGTLSLATLAISCVAVFMLSVLLRMAGKITGNRRMELWSGNMMYDIIITFIIAGAIIAFYSAFGSSAAGSPWVPSVAKVEAGDAPYFDSSKCVYGNAMSFLASATQYTLAVTKLSIWANGNMETLISATKTQPTLAMGFGYYTSTLAGQPIYPSIAKAKAMLGSIMSVAIMSSLTANTAQMFLLRMVLSPVMFALLAFAVILRPLPVFKYFANSVIAVLIAFMLVFPLMLTLEGLVLGQLWKDPGSVYDATDFKTEARAMDFMAGNWRDLISQSILSGLTGGAISMNWMMDRGGEGLRVICSGTLCKHGNPSVLIDVYALLNDVYLSFFISAFILSINTISIAAGSKAISTLMDEEESLMEMFVKVI